MSEPRPITGDALAPERAATCTRCDRAPLDRATLHGFRADGTPAAFVEQVRWWFCLECRMAQPTPVPDRRWRLSLTTPTGRTFTRPLADSGDEAAAWNDAQALRGDWRRGGGVHVAAITTGLLLKVGATEGAVVELRRPGGNLARRWLCLTDGEWKVTA